jgi:hypothetical protein
MGSVFQRERDLQKMTKARERACAQHIRTTDQRHCRESRTHTPRIVYVTASTDSVAPALDIQHSSNDLIYVSYASHPAARKAPSRGAASAYTTPDTCNERRTPETGMTRVRERGRREWGALCGGSESGLVSGS